MTGFVLNMTGFVLYMTDWLTDWLTDWQTDVSGMALWNHLPENVWHLPGTIWHLLETIWHIFKTILQLPKTIWHLPETIWHLPDTIWHLSKTIWHLPKMICHLPKIPWHLDTWSDMKEIGTDCFALFSSVFQAYFKTYCFCQSWLCNWSCLCYFYIRHYGKVKIRLFQSFPEKIIAYFLL